MARQATVSPRSRTKNPADSLSSIPIMASCASPAEDPQDVLPSTDVARADALHAALVSRDRIARDVGATSGVDRRAAIEKAASVQANALEAELDCLLCRSVGWRREKAHAPYHIPLYSERRPEASAVEMEVQNITETVRITRVFIALVPIRIQATK